jgi:hypothetical protein
LAACHGQQAHSCQSKNEINLSHTIPVFCDFDCCFYRLNGKGMKSLHLFCAKSVKQKKLASQVQDFAFSALYLKKGT